MATTGANDQPYRATTLLIKIGPSTFIAQKRAGFGKPIAQGQASLDQKVLLKRFNSVARRLLAFLLGLIAASLALALKQTFLSRLQFDWAGCWRELSPPLLGHVCSIRDLRGLADYCLCHTEKLTKDI
jgi:hypothetical protein